MSIRRRSVHYVVGTIASSAIPVVTLPLTTRILGPADYGLAALVATALGVGASLAVGPVPLVLARPFQETDTQGRRSLVTALTVLSIIVAIAWVAIVTLVYVVLRDQIESLAAIPSSALIAAGCGLILGCAWPVAAELLTLQGRGAYFSTAVFLQAAASAAAVLIALYAFDLKVVSLFIGMAVYGLAQLAMSVPVLKEQFSLTRYARALTTVKDVVPATLSSTLVEQSYVVLERGLLTTYTSLQQLGLFVHAQRYRDLAFLGVKALSRSIWPESLNEARARDSFVLTRDVWSVMYVALSIVGIVAALFGREFLRLLTNDKFTEAAVYIGPWFVYLVIQYANRPGFATALAHGEGRRVARASLLAGVTGITSLVFLVPLWGAWGALAAALVMRLVHQVSIMAIARGVRPDLGISEALPWLPIACVSAASIITIVSRALEVRAVSAVVLVVLLLACSRAPLIRMKARIKREGYPEGVGTSVSSINGGGTS